MIFLLFDLSSAVQIYVSYIYIQSYHFCIKLSGESYNMAYANEQQRLEQQFIKVFPYIYMALPILNY